MVISIHGLLVLTSGTPEVFYGIILNDLVYVYLNSWFISVDLQDISSMFRFMVRSPVYASQTYVIHARNIM